MSERLYYTDSYLRDFAARAIETSAEGLLVYLDRTAFYPTSGGQPFDLGTISGVAVTEVFDEAERVAHRVAAPIAVGPVECAIDWRRRFDHMQQHTGQHLLSAVFEELFHLKTVSFHMGADSSTIDLEGGAVDARVLADTERRVNEVIWENRAVAVQFEHAAEVQGLRKPSDREGTLRIVSIEGMDRSACGGTHVRATGEIGAVLLRKVEKVRQTTRVEFLCGGRAIRRARADYDALSRTAQLFPHRLTRCREWSPRHRKRLARGKRRAANWSWTWRRTRGANCTPPPNPGPTEFAAYRGGPSAAIWRSCAPSRRTSPRNRRPSSWQFCRIRRRSCWPCPRMRESMPARY